MNSEELFDVERVFDDDYLYFYEDLLSTQRTASETETIWRLCALDHGMGVLDIGCGHGRISNALAQRGTRVMGLDSTERFLEKAREDAAALGVDANYVLGDMRKIEWEQEFDCALIWFTTFGYFNEIENRKVLENATRALKPGGRLLIEQINRNALLHDGIPSRFIVRRGNDLLIDLVNYNGLTDRSETERIIVRNGNVRSAKYTVRLYSFSELSGLLTSLGMRTVEAFGQGGEPYTLYGKRLITLATK